MEEDPADIHQVIRKSEENGGWMNFSRLLWLTFTPVILAGK
jgi:hypothetical protein